MNEPLDLSAMEAAAESERQRLASAQTVEDMQGRIRRWITGAQVDLTQLNPSSLEAQLRDLGASILFSSPTVVKELETAILAHVAKGLMTNAQRDRRMAEIAAELAGYQEQLRAPAATFCNDPNLALPGDSITAAHETAATAKLEFRANGSLFAEINGVLRQRENWLARGWMEKIGRPGRAIRAEVTDGDTPEGAPLGKWLSLSTVPVSWGVSQQNVGRKHTELSIELSTNSGNTVAARAPFVLTAEVR